MRRTALPDEVDRLRAQLWKLGYRATLAPRRDAEWARMTRERICRYCSRKFEVRVPSNEGKYCSQDCYRNARIYEEFEPPTKDLNRKKYCPQCKVEILVPKNKFCTQKCYQDWRVGKPNGFETL
jgi:hypothetical protein